MGAVIHASSFWHSVHSLRTTSRLRKQETILIFVFVRLPISESTSPVFKVYHGPHTYLESQVVLAFHVWHIYGPTYYTGCLGSGFWKLIMTNIAWINLFHLKKIIIENPYLLITECTQLMITCYNTHLIHNGATSPLDFNWSYRTAIHSVSTERNVYGRVRNSTATMDRWTYRQ